MSRRDNETRLWPTGGMIERPGGFRGQKRRETEVNLWCRSTHPKGRNVIVYRSLVSGLGSWISWNCLEQDRQEICLLIGQKSSDRYSFISFIGFKNKLIWYASTSIYVEISRALAYATPRDRERYTHTNISVFVHVHDSTRGLRKTVLSKVLHFG